ncbi:butyrophilin subfamily 2 member A2-like [Pelodytes ibericus]
MQVHHENRELERASNMVNVQECRTDFWERNSTLRTAVIEENFKVVGSEAPVVVSLGDTAVLPCRLSPPINAESMTVRWFRSKFSFTVHLYQNGQNVDHQISEFQGRTSFNTSQITNGEVSLSIHNITPSDEGWYTCLFQSPSFYDATDLELKVSAYGSDPYIFVNDYQDGGLWAVCKSNGWYPKPVILWRDNDGQPLQSSNEVQTLNTRGLYDIEMFLILNATSMNKVSCVIRHHLLKHEEKSTIHLSETLFLRVSRCVISRILLVTSFVLISGIILSVGLFVFVTQRKRIGNLTEEKNEISEEKRRLLEEKEWRKHYYHKVPISLDANTAHPLLVLSEDHSYVKHGSTEQDVPDTPERFSTNPCVLAAEGFLSGRHYWEAEVVTDGGGWDIGAAKETVRKKGWIRLSPKEGIWALRLGRDQYQALTAPYSTQLPIRDRARKIGVYLDYEEGILSFFNVDSMKHVYTFNDTFTEKIYPFFNVWYEGLQIKV